jgi:precorrin-8X/cobalt-precorrin-8 methylmutase
MNKNGYGIVILGHGSKAEDANKVLLELAEQVGNSAPGKVAVASMQFGRPNLQEAVESLVNDGLKKILIAPLFFYKGAHMLMDIPEMVDDLRKSFPDCALELTENIGADPRIGSILLDRIWEKACLTVGQVDLDLDKATRAGEEIENKSFKIIESRISANGFSPREMEIVKRVVHASGDLGIVDSISFSESAVQSGINAIKQGGDVIADVNMVAAGVNASLLRKFRGKLICQLSSPAVKKRANLSGTTRSQVAIAQSMGIGKSPIVVIGNAPTALFEVLRLSKTGVAKPSLVIGMPVGFVGAAESKEELKKSGIPYITVTGTRGGSAMAVAATNALLKLCDSGS